MDDNPNKDEITQIIFAWTGLLAAATLLLNKNQIPPEIATRLLELSRKSVNLLERRN